VDPADKGREHARLGEIYLTHLGDAARARDELVKATRLSEGEPRAWDALARALVAVGDAPAAIAALERQIELHPAKGDAAGGARDRAGGGPLGEAIGAGAQAHGRYRRAQDLAPGDADVLSRLAGVTARRGHLAEALDLYERLAELEGADDARRRQARRELARLYLAAQDTAAARHHLERAQGGEEAERLEPPSPGGGTAGAADPAGAAGRRR